MKGWISYLDPRGFGYLQSDHGQRVFFHATSLVATRQGDRAAFNALTPGQRVTFHVAYVADRDRAVEVEIVP